MNTRFKTKDFRGAFKLHRQFRESTPTKARVIPYEVPKALMILGTLESVCYRTTHNGKAASYRHEFASGSRPFLAAGPKKGQLFIVGGRYRVTERGIVDLNARGREIDDADHGATITDDS